MPLQKEKNKRRTQPQKISEAEAAELGNANLVENVDVGSEFEEEEKLTLATPQPLRAPKSDETLSISSDRSNESKKKKITIGEYEISFPEEKLPLLGVMACAIILHISIFIDEKIYSSKYRYGIFLSIFAFFGALVSVAIPTKKTIALNYCIYVITYAGACLSTISPGPFTETGNGYFASWGLTICSAIAADPPGSLKRANFNAILNLGAAAFVVILALLPHFIEGTTFEVETYVTVIVAGATMMIVGLFLILKLCTWKSSTKGCGESIVLTIIGCLWVGVACLVTFRGPFKNTGNGYFASWFAVVMSVKAASLEMRSRILASRLSQQQT